MAKSLVNAKRSAIVVAVLAIIGSCATNDTNSTHGTTAEVTTTGTTTTHTTSRIKKIPAPDNERGVTDDTDYDDYAYTFQSNATTRNSSNDGARTGDGGRTISIEPLPDGIELPPATMMLIAGITCGVIIGVFLICYVATMMNLCFCKFLMHECPSGRFKDDELKEEKSKKKKGKDEEGKNTPSPEETTSPASKNP